MILLPEDGKTRVQLNSNSSYMLQESWSWLGVGGGVERVTLYSAHSESIGKSLSRRSLPQIGTL